MQMVVLLNNFEHDSELLAGGNGHVEKFGAINYYEDKEVLEWSNDFNNSRKSKRIKCGRKRCFQ
jgi:S-adenosylmethionine-dependent methyltransferase